MGAWQVFTGRSVWLWLGIIVSMITCKGNHQDEVYTAQELNKFQKTSAKTTTTPPPDPGKGGPIACTGYNDFSADYSFTGNLHMNFSLLNKKIDAPLSGGFTLICQGGTGDFKVTEFKVADGNVDEVKTRDGVITPPPQVIIAALTKLKKEVLIEFLTKNGLGPLAKMITEDKEVVFNAQGQFDPTFSHVALDDIKFDITDPNFKSMVAVTAELNATYAGATPNPIQYTPTP